MSIQPVHC